MRDLVQHDVRKDSASTGKPSEVALNNSHMPDRLVLQPWHGEAQHIGTAIETDEGSASSTTIPLFADPRCRCRQADQAVQPSRP
jgi:hypothetical protein